VDLSKTLLMCLIHDLGELFMGDIPANTSPNEEEKHAAEERDVKKVLSLLPEDQQKELFRLWQEYNENTTPEAKLVKALDKAETILQHNQGKNPPDFDYEFNLEYGKKYFQEDEKLLRLREKIDEDTENRMKE
ncbi:HD domain-containing protein, partial [Eisenbergiella tayi]|uniref:HD domain-containing protein n=1 Tax=Eisenbergiella tayi TaxID=1432052 RepID=UPI003AF02C47